LRSTDCSSELAYGHSMVMKALDLLEDGKPGLVVWDTCYHTKNGMEHYLRKRLNKASDSNVAVGDSKIIDKYKDFNDLLRYLCCDNVSKTTVQSVPVFFELIHIKERASLHKGSRIAILDRLNRYKCHCHGGNVNQICQVISP